MPTSLQAALLGVVQGLTEFLPVSSSAHLILARAFFGFDTEQFGLSFDVACHVGTLLAVVAYFREDVVAMVAALPRMFGGRRTAPAGRLRQGYGESAGALAAADAGGHVGVAVADREPHLIWLLIVGTIP